jgi:hypothetical protein
MQQQPADPVENSEALIEKDDDALETPEPIIAKVRIVLKAYSVSASVGLFITGLVAIITRNDNNNCTEGVPTWHLGIIGFWLMCA